MLESISIIIIIINIVTFFVYGIDKYKSKKGKWRIPENSLLGLAIIGGSIGAYLGMRIWHHKTMHLRFKYGIPFIIVMQLIIAYMFVK